ncbi:MAG: chorismate mutase [Chlorobiaceae bacterium]|nr:chorismate mutase [Chlorobiaceae bacterium]MBA4308813.1 chorismate mutase [Chlorobiaceae bacterium]
MDSIYKKINEELNSLSDIEREEILNRLRNEIDLLDEQIVALLSRRTFHSVLIGRVKKSLGISTYSPEREKDVATRVKKNKIEPLTDVAITRIYERILDESRAIQRAEAKKK